MTDEANVTADGTPVDAKVVAEDDGDPVDDGHESGHGPQDGGLAGAVGADQSDDLALADVEVTPGEGGEPAEKADSRSDVNSEAHASSDRLLATDRSPRPGFTAAFREGMESASAPPRPRRWRAEPPGKKVPEKTQGELEGDEGTDQTDQPDQTDQTDQTDRTGEVVEAEPKGPRPDRLAWVLAGIGKTLIFVGLVILGFVGYTLIGTNWAEARHQDDLRGQLQSVPPPAPIEASQPNEVPAPPAAPTGSAVAVIKIPRIGVEKAVVEGVELSLLKRGPGHYPGTPLPGQPGNSAIAGHRTTYGAPFFRLNEMEAGDPILVSTVQGQFLYEVREVRVVKPSAVEVLLPSADNRLTLTTCHPRFSAAERLVLIAELKGPAASSRPAPGAALPPPPRIIRDEVVGADGNPAKRVPTILWGLAALAVVVAAIVMAKRWKRWATYLIAAAPFLLCLWSFYANLAQVIPS